MQQEKSSYFYTLDYNIIFTTLGRPHYNHYFMFASIQRQFLPKNNITREKKELESCLQKLHVPVVVTQVLLTNNCS